MTSKVKITGLQVLRPHRTIAILVQRLRNEVSNWKFCS